MTTIVEKTFFANGMANNITPRLFGLLRNRLCAALFSLCALRQTVTLSLCAPRSQPHCASLGGLRACRSRSAVPDRRGGSRFIPRAHADKPEPGAVWAFFVLLNL